MCAKEVLQRGPGDRRTNFVESAAISASLLCLIHCLALPLLLLLLPGMLGLFAHSEAFHYAVLLLVVPSAFAAFWLGYRRHRAIVPALLGVAGVACLVLALLPGQAEGFETWATVAGSLLLVIGHTMNWRLRTRAA
jgi:hypothetical protein